MDPTAVIIAIAVGFTALWGAYSVAAERARSREFGPLARELGLRFREVSCHPWSRLRKENRPVDSAEISLWTDEEWLRRVTLSAHGGRCMRGAYGERSGRQVHLLDFAYRSEKTNVTTTVAVVHPTPAPAICWRLKPKGVWDKVAVAMGGQDIDLQRFPEFSGMFRLRSDSPARVEAMFDQKLTSFFEGYPGLFAASTGDRCVLFYWGRRLSVRKARELLLSAERLATLLEEGGKLRLPGLAQGVGPSERTDFVV